LPRSRLRRADCAGPGIARHRRGRGFEYRRAVREVAEYLGNTPTVCRKSYIDPRVIDLYHDGLTIAPDLEQLGADAAYGELATRGAIEAAVLRLLERQ
jgi:DNA topoisomerase I